MITATALAMDAFAVSIGVGACINYETFPPALRMGLACGGFQFLMPLIGWSMGIRFVQMISAYDHWLAFFLLFAIGLKMIWESRVEGDCRPNGDPTRGITLLTLALATSIDAMAVGVTMAAIQGPVFFLAISTGLITASLACAGIFIGGHLGKGLGKYMEIGGGIVLCLMAINILRSHLLS